MELPDEVGLVAEWAVRTFDTVTGLIEGRQRCQAMTIERLRDVCMASWTIQVTVEALRLRNELSFLTDEATADRFQETFVHCFGVDPDDLPPYPEYTNVEV